MPLILFDLFDTLATQVHPDRPAQQAFADKCGLAMPDEAAAWPGFPLTRYFEHVVFSCCAGCLKPELQIYQLACVHFGVLPREVIFVGDRSFDELQGAAALDMRPVQANCYRKRALKRDIEAAEPTSQERIEDLAGWFESI